MKRKITIGLLLFLQAVYLLHAQVQRISLLEEFTGENCNPCASNNPALNLLLAANSNSIIAIKWQVDIPSAPNALWSLYQTNKIENDWRKSGYNYQAQYTPSSSITNGILNAPTVIIDGKHQWSYGANSDHPFYTNTSVISNAASITTPFSIKMMASWDGLFNNAVVSVTVTAASAFISSSALVYRLCLVEREINFVTAPGSNNEKHFEDVVRKSYPSIQAGTILPSIWSAGQSQTFTVACAIPSYIIDKSQMSFVGFIQDDGNTRIWQASRTSSPILSNDAKAISVDLPATICANSVIPQALIKNNGSNAITAMTITPKLDGTLGSNIFWTGNLLPGNQTLIPLNAINYSNNFHNFSYIISNVSGGDLSDGNNYASKVFNKMPPTTPAPLTEVFSTSIFPPSGWALFNLDSGQYTFQSTGLVGGYGTSNESMLFELAYSAKGDADEIILPPTDLTGITNPVLSFDLAYAQNISSNHDSLIVFGSIDCGSTWTKLYENGGSTMGTCPLQNYSSSLIPLNSQWITVTKPLTAFSNNSNVLIKLKVKSDWGNRLFIDNINLQQPLNAALKDKTQNTNEFRFYPNPANSSITFNFNSNNPKLLQITNLIGLVIFEKEYTSSISDVVTTENIPNGSYIISIIENTTTKSKKLIINR